LYLKKRKKEKEKESELSKIPLDVPRNMSSNLRELGKLNG
jgi:hypothetical protein